MPRPRARASVGLGVLYLSCRDVATGPAPSVKAQACEGVLCASVDQFCAC
jgi:hypothetical protein